MRTVFVNPTKKKSRKRKSAPKAAAPVRKRRRRTHSAVLTSSGPVLVKRVNAGITPFVSNPLSNPRRRRRRNPNPLTGALEPKKFINKAVAFGGGSAIGAAANIFAIRKIENDWMRNGARVAAGVLGAAFMQGDMGAAMAGAIMYPMWAELALKMNLVAAGSAPATEIDLNELSGIDLNDGSELFEW